MNAYFMRKYAKNIVYPQINIFTFDNTGNSIIANMSTDRIAVRQTLQFIEEHISYVNASGDVGAVCCRCSFITKCTSKAIA